MAKDGLGIFHFPSGLGIDIEAVMAELREVLESRGWEFGVTALLWQLCSASLTGCEVWLCHFLGGGSGQVWASKPWLWSEPCPAHTLHQARTKTTTGLEQEEH